MWKDITDTQQFRDLDRYFLLLCRAQDVFAELNKKYSGYEIQYVLTFLENCDVELYVYTLTPDGSYESRIYWDNETGELKQFLQKDSIKR